MVWQSYPKFKEPDSDDAMVWRYMDLAKLIDMLSRKAIFFTQISELRKSDRFEGLVSDADCLAFSEHASKSYHGPASDLERYKSTVAKNIAGTFSKNSSQILVNCWHLSHGESMAMWKMYAPHSIGVAVASTYGKLKAAFRNSPVPVRIGLVEYQKFGSRLVSLSNAFAPALVKMSAFSHESELRAIIWTGDLVISRETGGRYRWIAPPEISGGSHVGIELDLIEEVRVPPTSPAWYTDVIRTTVSAFGLTPNIVRQSEMD
jgi:hypothetical protein